MEYNEKSPERGVPNLFKEKFGLKVLRELAPEELVRQPTEVVTTPEGFNICGQNDTSLIRSLKSLNGTPISSLQERMRPAVESILDSRPPGGGISMGGFLGTNESLTDVLAEDNDTVLGMGLTHQQLADFLLYFDKADKYVYEQTKEIPRAYEFNGRTFFYTHNVYRGMQESPFYDAATNKDNTILCVDDGSAISYSGLLPAMIYRYGFYEGKKVGYRLDPKRISEVAGFTPRPEDDPVVKLVKDRSAAVEFTTDEQFNRVGNLSRAGIDLLGSPNYKTVPQDIESLVSYVGLFDRTELERRGMTIEQRESYQKTVVGHIDTSRLAPQTIDLGKYRTHGLTDNIMYDFPQLKEPVLSNVKAIDFPTDESNSTGFESERFVKQALNAITKKGEDGTDHPHKDYLQGLLSKVKRSPENTSRIYQVATEIYDSGSRGYGYYGIKTPDINDEKLKELAEALDATFPTFRGDVIELYQQLGMPVSEEMSTADLIRSKESIENYKKTVREAADFARRIGGLETVSETDMGKLVNAVLKASQDPEYKYSPGETEAMGKLRVDPSLIPYAFRAVGGAKPPVSMVIAQLYNGAAGEERDLDYALAQLPSNMDERAKAAAQEVIRAQIKFRALEKIDVSKFIGQLAEREKEAAKQQKQLTEAEVLGEYVGLMIPPFKNLLTSSFVRINLNPKDSRSPVRASFNQEALEEIPAETTRPGRLFPYRKIVIGEDEYTIDDFSVKRGEFSLRVNSGNISLHTQRGH